MPRIAEDVYIKIEDTKGSLTCKEKKKVKKEERVANTGLVSKSTFFVFCSIFCIEWAPEKMLRLVTLLFAPPSLISEGTKKGQADLGKVLFQTLAPPTTHWI